MAALKAVLYLAEQAAVQHNALRTGISILANFNGVGFNRMDNRLHRQVVELLTGAYPGRVCRVYIVKPSRLFSVFLRVAGTFAKKKLVNKLVTVPNFEDLKSHIEPDQLLPAFGGSLEYDHGVWVDSRLVCRPVLLRWLGAWISSNPKSRCFPVDLAPALNFPRLQSAYTSRKFLQMKSWMRFGLLSEEGPCHVLQPKCKNSNNSCFQGDAERTPETARAATCTRDGTPRSTRGQCEE
jgi:hypothetical protein